MASSLQSDSACVVWNINGGLNNYTPVLQSKPFLLFGFERNLEFHFNSSGSYKLHLKPPLISSRIQFTCFGVDSNNSIVMTHSIVMPNLYSEIFDCSRIRLYGGYLSSIKKIVCIFESILPPTQTSPENATICIGCNHQSLDDLSSDFGRFLEDKTFPDVTLKCGDRTMSAHRSVLAARSPVFAAMFRNKMAESGTGVVEMGDINPDLLEAFLKYLYTGNIKNMSQKNVHFYFAIGERYDVQPLLKECSQWIRNNLTRQNCIPYLYMAGTYNYEYLINIVTEFIVRDSSIFKSEEWSKFKKVNAVVAVSVYDKYINTQCCNKGVEKEAPATGASIFGAQQNPMRFERGFNFS